MRVMNKDNREVKKGTKVKKAEQVLRFTYTRGNNQ